MTTELFINKDVSKRDETIHDECGIKCKIIKYQTCHVALCFNRMIELNQKMLILSKFQTRNYFYVTKTT